MVSSLFGGGAQKDAQKQMAATQAQAQSDREAARVSQVRQLETQRAADQGDASKAGAFGRRPRGQRLLLSRESGGASGVLGSQ